MSTNTLNTLFVEGPISSRLRSLGRDVFGRRPTRKRTYPCDVCDQTIYRGIHVRPDLRCPDCERVTDIEQMKEASMIWFEEWCHCPCRCEPPLSDEMDTDYTASEEDAEEDDTHECLRGRAAEGEQFFARKYGWTVCATTRTEQDSPDDKDYFLESLGHMAVSQMHDIGCPAESSMPNSENTIGEIEARFLRSPLEPWEVEAVHLLTGCDYENLTGTFREVAWMDIPRPQIAPPPEVLCERCHLPHSEDFTQWLERGVPTCEFCGIVRRPHNAAEDPDFHDFNPSLRNVLACCHCRCDCDVEALRAAEDEVDPFHAEVAETESPEALEHIDEDQLMQLLGQARLQNTSQSLPNSGIQDYPDTREGHAAQFDALDTAIRAAEEQSNLFSEFVHRTGASRSAVEADSDTEDEIPTYEPIGTNGSQTPELSEIRDYINLQAMHFGPPERPTALVDTIRTALATARRLHDDENYEDVLRYVEVALYLAFLVPLQDGPELLRRATNLAVDLHEHLNENEEFLYIDIRLSTLEELLEATAERTEAAGYDTIEGWELNDLLRRYFRRN